ncbi:hypothetical protein F5Y16DRAFT_423501 [Xylariaceae sp. FL0255]|nr:hypothetical protein F5Y16DRAFT_423501 [Xylariaceae sp. FL0255]
MKINYQWNLTGLGNFYVCGANQSDRRFAAEVHTGHSMSGPLGSKAGIHLYNGPSNKSQLLAVAGEDSFWARYALAFNNNSQVFLPGLKASNLEAEMMHSRTLPKPSNTVAFRFGIEVGSGEKTRRDIFEWRKVKKSEVDDDLDHGGFKLYGLGPVYEAEIASGSSGSGGNNQATTALIDEEHEVVAIFSWRKFLTSPKHPFDLEMTGSGRCMGERWTLMVLMTALRLWMMHLNGKTSDRIIAAGEKIHDKADTIVS